MRFHSPRQLDRQTGLIAAGIVLAALIGAGTGAWAQTQYIGEPAFRDPASGRIYTPSNVSKDGQPVPPEDRAFDPRSQQGGPTLGTSFQMPPWRPIGAVPVVSGPGSSVPAISFEPFSLKPATPGPWVLELAVANNTAYPISPQIECAFSNGGHVVANVAVRLNDIPPGQRVQASIMGPDSAQMFVDNAPCAAIGQ